MPRSANQAKYIQAIQDNSIVLCYGPAGSGKTHVAVGMAVQMLKANLIERIIISRSIVEAGRNSIGYLPGTMEEKVGPYLIPLFDELSYYVETMTLRKWMELKKLEIVPISMMRGRTFNDAFVILDEAQNSMLNEIRLFMTRIGANSRMVIVGDHAQSDLPVGLRGDFVACARRLAHVDGIESIELDATDIVRHPLIAEIEKALYDMDTD